MSKIVLILLATSVGLGLLSLYQVKQLQDREAAITALRAEVAELVQRQAAAQPLPPPLTSSVLMPDGPALLVPPPQVGGIAKSAAPPPSPMGAGIQPRPQPQPPSHEERLRMMREYRERQRELMQDPEYREAMRVQQRGSFARQYPGVIQELGLDPGQADEFFGLLADQQLRSNEQMAQFWEVDASEQLDATAGQERQRKIQQAASELQQKSDAELAVRFGQDKLRAWKEYQSTLGYRHQLEQMRTTLAGQGVPLADDLSAPMLKALSAAHQAEAGQYTAGVMTAGGVGVAVPALGRFSANGAVVSPDATANLQQYLELTKQRNQRILDSISPYLTSDQRSAIEKDQEAQLKMQEAQLRLMRARSNANEGQVIESNAVFAPAR